MATSSTGSSTASALQSSSSSSSSSNPNNALTSLNLDQFLKLMVTQLQNQDPLNPTDNNQILQQISSMQQINSSSKLNSTLDSVLLGQNISSASTLVGKTIKGIDDQGNAVNGVVDKVTITNNIPYLHVGNNQVRLSNVGEIIGTPTTTATTPTTTTPAA